ncbi:ROK family protein [candidate division KSB1 bacterium]|nr:ROK family protein [candidate division KSB1 bacterium]
MGLYIGLDLGGTNLKYALGDETGKLSTKKSMPSLSNENQDKIFENIFSAIEELLDETDSDIPAIGMGTPGSVNFERGQLNGTTPNIPDWTNAPIKKSIEDKFGIPTYVDNDANVVALAEARCGAAADCSSVVCFTIGTGIGGGIILDNKILRGASYSAAEVGHITVEMNGKPCGCGNFGCLEAYAAAPAMIKRYRHKLKRTGLLYKEDQLSPEFIFQKAAVEEDFAIETINETCDYLGTGIASIVNVLNPEMVLIGGGVSEAGEEFIQRIEKVVRQKIMKACSDVLKVGKVQLGNDAGVVGAILLAAEGK